MPAIKTLQGYTFKIAFGAENETEEEGSGLYPLKRAITISKTSDGKPLKIYSRHNTGKYIDHGRWCIKQGKLEDLKNFLESNGETKYENEDIKGLDNGYPSTDIDVEVVNVCHALVLRLAQL